MARGKYSKAKKAPVPIAAILAEIDAARAAAKLPQAVSDGAPAEVTPDDLRTAWADCFQVLETAGQLTVDAEALAAEVEEPPHDVAEAREKLAADRKKLDADRKALDEDREKAAAELERLAAKHEAARAAERRAEERHEELDARQDDLDERQASVAEGQRTLEAERQGLEREAGDILALRKDAEDRLAAVKDAERNLDAREQEARAGFAAAALDELEQQRARRDALARELSALEVRKETIRAEHDEIVREVLKRQDEELRTRREELQQGERELRDALRELEIDRFAVTQEQADINAQRADIERTIERHGAREQAELRRDLALARESMERGAAERAELERLLQQRTRSWEIFDDRSEDDVAEELSRLRDQVAAQEQALRRRPSEDLRAILTKREQERDAALEDLAVARREVDELDARLGSVHVGRLELETVRDERDVLAQKNETYRRMIEEHKAEWARLVEGDHTRPVFELMSAMDADKQLQKPIETTAPESLATLLVAVRKRIAKRGLFYSERDLRLFLAGMAMSRLTILEGLSGIGKTSLPREFAYAVGGMPAIVEIQSGWRDRHDLLGHYNTFERRYEESAFVQALYRAQCPEFEDRVVVVILDEMNLSHAEQYLADLNSGVLASASQLHTHRRHATSDRVTLMNREVKGAPAKFKDKGRKLVIPQNVWFAGTANQDESTVGFGDKTYDRAHIQHLPAAPKRDSVPKSLPKKELISVEALRECFTEAHNEHADEAKAAVAWLAELRPEFVQRADVTWGSRLEDQFTHFAPIVLAAKGDIGEAIDHIVATRILRKVCGRHDIPVEDVSAIKSAFEKRWPSLGADEQPSVSIELLKRDIERLQQGR